MSDWKDGSAGRYDITIEQGASFALKLDYKDSEDTTLNVSSGISARMQIRESIGGILIAWGDTSSDGAPSDAVGETLKHIAFAPLGSTVPNIDISISQSYTANYTASQFEGAVYELELFDATSVTRIMEGHAYLSQRVIK